MRKNWSTGFLAGALALGLTASGCGHMKNESSKAKVDDTRLAGIPEDQKTEMNQAQQQLDQFKQNQAQAKQAVTEADNRVKVADSELDVAKAQHKQAESVLKMQSKQGNQDQTNAQNNVDMAKKHVDAAQAKVDYLKSLKSIAQSQEDLANKQVELGQAQMEQAKFLTLQNTNPAEAQAMKLTPAQFEARVAEKQADVTKVEAKIAQERIEAREKYGKWSQLDEQLQGGTIEQRRANVPPPPRG